MPIKTVAFAIAAAFASSGAAPEKVIDPVNTEDGTGWHTVRVKPILNGKPVPSMYVAYTEDESRPGAALYCREDMLRVRFSVEGTDLRKTLTDLFPRARRETITLLLEGAEVNTSRYAYLPEHKTVTARDRVPAAKVFNAVVKGEAVAIKRGGATIDVALPPLDDEFRQFVDGCKQTGAI